MTAMADDGATEMMPRKGKKDRPVREIETDYQPVNWKRLFLAPKYLGACPALPVSLSTAAGEFSWADESEQHAGSSQSPPSFSPSSSPSNMTRSLR
jgi:hypothetical protein